MEAVRRLVDRLHPDAIYLYGSHAYGAPHADSDIDLLVVLPDGVESLRRRAVEGYGALRGLSMPAELKVVNRSGFHRRSKWLSSVERQAITKGKLLYAGG